MILNRKLLFVALCMTSMLFAQNRIAVIRFEANGVTPEEAKAFTEHLQVAVFNRENYTVIERREIYAQLEEQGFDPAVCSGKLCLQKAGEILEVDYIIGGILNQVGEVYSVTAKLVSVADQEVVNTFAYDHSGDIVALFDSGVTEIIQQLLAPIKETVAQSEKAVAEQPAPLEPAEEISKEEESSLPKSSGATSDTSSAYNGGFVPCLASCLIGPRVGLEMNEGITEIHQAEWISLGGQLVGGSLAYPPNPFSNLIITGTRAYMAYELGGKRNGLEGGLASFFIGPRVGQELHYRKIRNKEWMLLIPCVNIYAAISIPLEAYDGKTMTEIEKKEGLRRE